MIRFDALTRLAQRMYFALAALLVLLISVGCSGGGASISGTVEKDGTALPGGQIVFSSDNNSCSGIIENGQFTLSHQGSSYIPLDTYTVTVFPPPTEVKFNPRTQDEEPIAPTYDVSLYPKKYQSKRTSDLQFTVENGNNEFKIVLESN